MVCGILSFSSALSPISISHYRNRTAPKLETDLSSSVALGIRCSISSSDVPQTFENSENDAAMTGGAFDFTRATTSLTDNKSIASSKKVTLVRHGLSSWNEESRVQGSSNQSVLTETGVMQAERCRKAIANMHFDQCYSSPISRAKSTAEIIWQGREEPLVFLNSLKEAHLFFLEGMKNDDAKQRYPKEYATWREDPANFYVNGIYPVRELWGTAREAWKEILLTPGEHVLVITHKSILRALICTALGLGPERFRAIDVNNGGISVFNFNKKGEAMIQSLNMTTHMYSDHVTDTLEGADPSSLANKVARVVGSANPGEPSLETVQELAKENGSFQEQEQIQAQ
ncbi:unnamed protein product, partial [Prunus brigantina]